MSVYRVQPAKSSELSFPKARPTLDENFLQAKVVDPSMSFTRSSGGTYVGADGLIKIAGVNQPRFDHDPITGECRGLLVEESRTNLTNYSQDFSQSFWDKLYGTTVISGATIAPDGTQTAFRAFKNTGTNDYAYVTKYTGGGLSVTAGQTYTVSCFVKKVENSTLDSISISFDTSGQGGNPMNSGAVYFNIATESFAFTSGTSFQKFPNGWYRISLTSTALISGTIEYGIVFDDHPRGFYIWGFQLELGNRATSYIPTGASNITRAADRPIINTPLGTSGTLYAEATTPTTSGLIFTADNGNSALSMTLNHGNTSRYALYYNQNRYLQTSSSTSLVPSEVLGTKIPSGMNRISLGYSQFNNGTNYINGHIRRFSYYASPLTENNVKTLVSNTTATYRETENIVTSGLVLNLDADNLRSYTRNSTTWYDISGSGNNGTLTNGPTYDSANTGSVYLDGSGDTLQSPYDASLTFGSGDFTIEAWINPSTIESGKNIPIVGIWDDSSSAPQSWVIFIDTTGKLRFLVDVAGGDTLVTTSPNNILTNVWQHIAITRSGSTSYMFINGVQVASAGVSFTISAGSAPLIIGINQNTIPSNTFYNGYISNLRIVKGTALYTSSFTPPTKPLQVVANTTFLGCTSSEGATVELTGKTVITTGNASARSFSPTFVTGASSIVFDGVDDFVTGNITPLTGNYSVEIIFKLISFPAADSSLLAFSGPAGHGFLAEIRSSDKKIRFLHRFPYGISGGDTYYSNGTVDLNQIYCITWVRDSNLKLYINSVFDSQLTGTTSFFDSNLTSMCVGRLLPTGADRHTNGNIYSVKTYNRALSQQEITQNFNAQRQRYGI